MSDRLQTLLSLFVAPPAARPDAAGVGAADFTPPAGGSSGRRRAGRRRRRASAAPGRRRATVPTAVVGDAGCAAFAVDLAVASATRAGLRTAVTAVWGGELSPAPPHGHPTRAAEQLTGDLAAADVGSVVAGGRGVVIGLDADPDRALAALLRIQVLAGAGAGVLLAICGPRPAAFDPVLADGEVLVLAVAAGAPDGLEDLAAAALRRTAPAARVAMVTLEGGGALPRPLRHRAAIRQVLAVAR